MPKTAFGTEAPEDARATDARDTSARATDARGDAREEFTRRTEPYRRELLAHCYRMLGSTHDAEDLVQDVYLRAWRSYGEFEERASMRTWLYRIATNACLNALQHSSRRVMPSGLGLPAHDMPAQAEHLTEVPWLEPIPDRLLGASDDPAAVVAGRADLRLALVLALQHLPARQRAVLLLRETLGMPTTQIADLLDISTAAVNSSLQRARAKIDELAPASDQVSEPDDPGSRALLNEYASAFERSDIPALTRLFAEDAIMEMPPVAVYFQGVHALTRFYEVKLPKDPGVCKMVPTAANGQPGYAMYMREPEGTFTFRSLHVLTLRGNAISRVSMFRGDGVADIFGLPETLESDFDDWSSLGRAPRP